MSYLSAALDSSWQSTAGFSALLGLLLHQTIRHLEIDNRGWELVFTYLGVLASLFVNYVTFSSLGVTSALLRTWLAGSAFLLGLYSSMLVYRAFFHQLRRFPGPFAARLSNAYHMIIIKRTNMRYHRHVQKLHACYGDFVRTGPREISVIRASAINLVYGPMSTCEKATWYDQNSGDADKVGIENIRSKEKHRLRRRAWDKGLGFRALSVYESRVKAKVDLLLARIGTMEPLNITQQSVFYSFDVMGDIAFSEDFKMLHTGEEHPAIASLHEAMSIAGLVTTLPWLMNMLRVVPGATGKFERFAGWCYEQLRLKRESLAAERAANSKQEPRDVMTWLIKAMDEGDRSAPPTESAIQEDVRTLISAGSDTVAITFTNTLYFLVKYPAVYQKLQRLMAAEFPSGYGAWTYEKAKSIPYVDYIIHETLRLRPAVPMGFLRQTPPQGLQVDEVFIPGDTIINVPTYTIHRDERYFEEATEFVPERWETLSPDTAAYLAFQRGPFMCSGRNLAIMQLRMLISCLALRYSIAFAPGEDGVAFADGEKETLTMWIPPLQMVFTPL
ncbi:cytochrome P450 [Dothidotthia symphoricarpi CBS 119687]|uniref:Cytochrome P450 n=1 Tax=Dothidotthia symphoricarpi CBS 119687 TaxID=1392245 RepID=A0A6A6AT27_9PLEO|nr:cytochrome P450 [Dothidotthia symphoricarpi CBS 119687]KAF2134736.1 cytochrome P450 [Dothidotthia symphoricarpi CBS 119687]